MVTHTVSVRAPSALLEDSAPLLLERTDARFMDGVRNELSDRQKWPQLLGTRVKRDEGGIKLLQPIHRAFNVAVVEVVCQTPGEPRLDPQKIESAGLVVRQVVERADGQARVSGVLADRNGERSLEATHAGGQLLVTQEGERRDATNRLAVRSDRAWSERAWMRLDNSIQGWVELEPRFGAVSLSDDPDAARRRRPGTHPVLAQHAARLRFAPAALSEDVSELFVLPPAVSSSSEATLLYGLVPTASLDYVKAEPSVLFTAADVQSDLPAFLKSLKTLAAERRTAPSVPAAGGVLERPNGPILDPLVKAYAEFVERVIAEYDLFGQTPGADRLRAALDGITVVVTRGGEDQTRSLTEHLAEAAKVFVFGPPLATPENPQPEDAVVFMPKAWPEISERAEAAIVAAVGDVLRDQVERLQSHEGRFSRPNARYIVRAFVRVRRDDGCPPALFWSAPSEPFSIAQWFEPGRGPTPIVPLPDPFKDLRKFKPNVAFALPASISEIVHRNTAEDLRDGKGKRGSGGGLGWLCGFSIPLITLCAFIVLSIFLSLLQIVFWWLAFIRICIPIPKRS